VTIHPCIFDLDGTLVDSIGDIANATNWALAQHGLDPHPEDAYRTFLGEGLQVLITKALGPSHAHLIDQVMAAYRREYARKLVEHTVPYPGIVVTLDELAKRRVPLAVLSNKPHEYTVPIVEAIFPDTTFVAVFGHRKHCERKPDPASALEIAQRFGVSPGSCLFVGDTPIDVHTAANAGMVSVGVSWGFRSPAELQRAGARHLVNSAQELLSLAFAPD
jgi:phosphoglycolate phosphatase